MGGNNRQKSYRKKLTRVQRLMNIKLVKAYRTVSNGALCVMKGVTPIYIEIKEKAEHYNIVSGK